MGGGEYRRGRRLTTEILVCCKGAFVLVGFIFPESELG